MAFSFGCNLCPSGVPDTSLTSLSMTFLSTGQVLKTAAQRLESKGFGASFKGLNLVDGQADFFSAVHEAKPGDVLHMATTQGQVNHYELTENTFDGFPVWIAH